MMRRTPVDIVLLLLLSLLLAFCNAQKAAEGITTSKPSLQPKDDPALMTWLIIGVISATTMSVLVLLIPTLLYYKYIASQDIEIDSIKK